VKSRGSTEEVPSILVVLSTGEESGIPGVEVKFVDMGGTPVAKAALWTILTLRRESVGSKQD
jgi:hypothetical protein